MEVSNPFVSSRWTPHRLNLCHFRRESNLDRDCLRDSKWVSLHFIPLCYLSRQAILLIYSN